MKLFKGEASVKELELLVWAAVYIVVFFTLLPEDGLLQSFSFALINTGFYALIIYGNIKFLYPRLYEPKKYMAYVLTVLLALLLIGISRCYAIMLFHNLMFPAEPEAITIVRIANFVTAGLLIFVLSFVFRIALAYFAIKKQSEQILLQKSQAELGLLKSQVQPHFLFNTLNNINYVLYREAPQSAVLIERLADIMRYFVEDSPNDKVSIATEVKFLENYIELEKIRIRFKTEINFVKDYQETVMIPPMLLMTFVENIFKHGIDKSGNNSICLSLIQDQGHLTFQTINRITGEKVAMGGKFGLQNLRQRLKLLYQTRFDLRTEECNNSFTAILKIPI